MTHQCPKCELRFTWVTEVDDHCRTDHPEFHHDYPASVEHDYSTPAAKIAGKNPVHTHLDGEDSSRILSTYWNNRR
jgi:hypothetical protein